MSEPTYDVKALLAEIAVKRIQVETQKANIQAYRLEAQEAQAENAALRAEVERLRHFVALVQSDVEVERAWQDWERGGKGGQHAGSRPWNAWGYMVLLNFEKYLRHLKEADDA